MQSEKGFIKYIVIVGVILAVAFFSQQAYFRGTADSSQPANDSVHEYLTKGSDWVKDNVYDKISGEVEKRGDMLTEGIENEKEKITQSVGEKIKNYFSGIVDSVIHPGSDECQCPCQDAAQP